MTTPSTKSGATMRISEEDPLPSDRIIFDTNADPTLVPRYRTKLTQLIADPGTSVQLRAHFENIYNRADERLLLRDGTLDKVANADRINPEGPPIVFVAEIDMIDQNDRAAMEAWNLALGVVNPPPTN